MAKPLRSPVVGYNHNVRYHGRVFHVQSEDSGPTIPRVFTHLFFEGTILVTRKHEYDVSADEDAVRAQMQQLHKSLIKELTRGDHDVKIAAFFTARGLPPILPDAPAVARGPSVTPAPVRQTGAQPVAPAAAASPPAAHAPVAAPAAMVVQGSGMVGGAPVGDKRSPTRPAGTRPQGIPRQPMPMVKPSELKRPPVVLSSSADGVVVQRNVVIGVGGATPAPSPTRPPRIRPPVPYVVREGSYAFHNGAGSTPAEGAPARATVPTGVTPSPAPAQVSHAPDRRTPHASSEGKAFASELVSDKSLDEVILEYLSDDSETDES